MGVYIKRMKKPKNCLVCPCTDTEYGECVLDPEKRCPKDYDKIADWCPLVHVPPHGRLIDADAFLALINDSTILSDFLKCIINSLIRGEPTVIEAEEGE